MATLYVRDGKVVVRGYDELAQPVKDAIQSVLDEVDVAPTFVEPSTLVAPGYLAAQLGKCIQPTSRRAIALERVRTQSARVRSYPEVLDADAILATARALAEHIVQHHDAIARVLERYETYDVARDEIARTLELLWHLGENRAYFQRRVGEVTTFLPCNQPLYALACFGIVPAWMAMAAHVRPATAMREFFRELVAALELARYCPNLVVSDENRAAFIAARATCVPGRQANDAVIFTGTHHNATAVRAQFDPSTLFIVNGSGHNPVVVTKTANVERAVESILRVQLYNQGQDCASPNAVLVHRDVVDAVLARLRDALARVRVGPVTRRGSLPRIQELLVDNARWLRTPGVIRTAEAIVEPAIIERPLAEGGNFTEQFAPIFFVQRYDEDAELARYFEDPRYALHAMYVTVFGESAYVDGLVDKRFAGRPLHDASTILRDTDLHAPGVERGTQPYGGYGAGASYVHMHGTTIAKPTLPQRDLYEMLVRPAVDEHEGAERATLGERANGVGERATLGERANGVGAVGERATLDTRANAIAPIGGYLDPAIAPIDESRVTPLVDADYFGAVMAAVSRTRRGDAIYMMTYQFDPKFLGIGELLAAKAAIGVDVRIVLNGTRTPINPWRENEAAAAALRAYPSLADRVLVETAGLRMLGSQHQKAIIVATRDDAVAFAGGMDFVPDHFDRIGHDTKQWPDGSAWGWHDIGVEVRGAAVHRIWATFAERWAAAKARAGSPMAPEPRGTKQVGACPARAVSSSQRVQVVRSRVVPGERPVRELCEAYRTAIAHAERYLYIEDQFLCDHAAEHLGLPLPSAPVSLRGYSLFDDIADRMRVRPQLQVIFVGSGKSDPIDFLPGARNRKLTPSVRRLLARLPAARRDNVSVWRIDDVTVHSKLMLVDDVFAAIGSANFRARSFYGVDSELQVLFVDRDVAQLRARLWAEHLGLLPIEQVLLEDLDRALAAWRGVGLPARRRSRLVAVRDHRA